MKGTLLRLAALGAIGVYGVVTARTADDDPGPSPAPDVKYDHVCRNIENCGAASQEDRCWMKSQGADCSKYCDGQYQRKMCVRQDSSTCTQTSLPTCGAMWSGACIDHDNNPNTPLRCEGTIYEGGSCKVAGC